MQKEYQNQLINYLLEEWVAEGKIKNYDALKTGFTCADAPDFDQCRRDSIQTKATVDTNLERVESYNQMKIKGKL